MISQGKRGTIASSSNIDENNNNDAMLDDIKPSDTKVDVRVRNELVLSEEVLGETQFLTPIPHSPHPPF